MELFIELFFWPGHALNLHQIKTFLQMVQGAEFRILQNRSFRSQNAALLAAVITGWILFGAVPLSISSQVEDSVRPQSPWIHKLYFQELSNELQFSNSIIEGCIPGFQTNVFHPNTKTPGEKGPQRPHIQKKFQISRLCKASPLRALCP